MATYTETIELADVVVGDRWIGVTVGPVTINGSTPSRALERVVMTFRIGQSTFTLDSDEEDDDVEITDADSWEVSFAARDDFLERAGKWQWDMAFFSEGYDSPWTLYSGVIKVHDDIG